jgi:hypothetical protein
MDSASWQEGMLSAHETEAAPEGIFVYRADVDARYERARAAGAEIVHPPRDEILWPTPHPRFVRTPSAEQ